MSVIRQPGVLGRTTRRRLVGVTVALTAAAVETLAVGLWFGLVVDSPSSSTALAGLGILFCGSVLRAGVFGAAVSALGDFLQPRRLAAALALTGGWLSWLFVADALGGVSGVAVATLVLLLVLTGQFVFERRVFERRTTSRPTIASILPAALLALGGSILLGVTWFTDFHLVSPPLTFEATTVVLQIEPVQVGVLLFGLLAFLAHQRRFQYVLSP